MLYSNPVMMLNDYNQSANIVVINGLHEGDASISPVLTLDKLALDLLGYCLVQLTVSSKGLLL